jgi:polyhydroxyalkanoate synthesis regulator phasin
MNIEQWHVSKEQEVKELKNLWESGGISESEYKELVEDILDISKIQDDLATEDLKNKAVKAIDAIKVVAGLIA